MVYKDYDTAGYRYKTGFSVRGAYSQHELHYGQVLASVGNTNQTINGLVYNIDSAGLAYSIQKLGNNLFRFEVNQGEGRPSDSGVERAELSGSANTVPYGTDVWTAYSFLMDSANSWSAHDANICGQFHAGVGSPNLSFRFPSPTTMEITIRAGVSSSYTQTIAYTNNAFQQGKWYNVVIQANFSPGTATGTLNVWIDGTQVVNLTSFTTGYSDASSTYFKAGIYRSTSEPENQVVYFANIETGTTNLSSRILNPLSI